SAGQDPSPFTGTAPFGPPRLAPANGSTVGVAQPIIINFPGPVDDSGAAEGAVHVSSVPPVPGKFYWMTPTQLRWRPLSFWPAHTAVTVDAGGTVSTFQTGDALVGTAADATHQLTISPTNAKWFFDNFGAGDPIVVKNSSGGTYSRHDGSNDWQL